MTIFRIDTDDGKKVELGFTPEMIEKVLSEWEEENPGKDARDMTGDEFSRRMMIEIKASARLVLPPGVGP